MVVCLTLMLGYAAAKASIAPLSAVPSAGEDSHWPSVTSPLMEAGSKVFSLSAGGAPDSPPVPSVDGAPELPLPPQAAATNMTAKERVRNRLRMRLPPQGRVDRLAIVRRSPKVRTDLGVAARMPSLTLHGDYGDG